MSTDLVDIRSILNGKLSMAAISPRLLPSIASADKGGRKNQSVVAGKRVGRQGKSPASTESLDRLLRAVKGISAESAIDASALGFMARMLVQTTLPHREQPGNQYTRTDGNLTVSITALNGFGLPYGSYPRLILIWMTTEAVRTRKRELVLGKSLSQFMAQLGLQTTGGHWGTIARFRDQMERLMGAAIATRWFGEEAATCRATGQNLLLADSFDLWWRPQSLKAKGTLASTVVLSQGFFDQIVGTAVPLDLRAVRALKQSPLALDLYAWATRRVGYLHRPVLIPWSALRLSFGTGYAETPQGKSRFRANAIDALSKVGVVYPQLSWQLQENGLLLHPSTVHVPKLSR